MALARRLACSSPTAGRLGTWRPRGGGTGWRSACRVTPSLCLPIRAASRWGGAGCECVGGAGWVRPGRCPCTQVAEPTLPRPLLCSPAASPRCHPLAARCKPRMHSAAARLAWEGLLAWEPCHLDRRLDRACKKAAPSVAGRAVPGACPSTGVFHGLAPRCAPTSCGAGGGPGRQGCHAGVPRPDPARRARGSLGPRLWPPLQLLLCVHARRAPRHQLLVPAG